MKIGIFGSYNRASIGDHAILEGMLSQLRARSDHLEYVVFSLDAPTTRDLLWKRDDLRVVSGRPACSRRAASGPQGEEAAVEPSSGSGLRTAWAALPGPIRAPLRRIRRRFRDPLRDLALLRRLAFWRRIGREIATLDLLLIGGGNLVMDLYPSWPMLPLIYASLGRRARVPVMFYAVGAGPIRSRRGRRQLAWACRLASGLSFRDQASLNLVAEALGRDRGRLALSADPALRLRPVEPGHEASLLPRELIAEGASQARVPIVGMTLVPYYKSGYWPQPRPDVYRAYTGQMVRLIEALVERTEARVVLFATNHPPDLEAARDVLARVSSPARIQLIEERLGLSQILALLAACDLVIGTRLHSLILALVAETPALALAYQPKVADFYRRLDLERFAVEPGPDLRFDEVEILRRFELLTQERDGLRPHLRSVLRELQRSADRSAELALGLAAGGAWPAAERAGR